MEAPSAPPAIVPMKRRRLSFDVLLSSATVVLPLSKAWSGGR
jgi:hypothetical protein